MSKEAAQFVSYQLHKYIGRIYSSPQYQFFIKIDVQHNKSVLHIFLIRAPFVTLEGKVGLNHAQYYIRRRGPPLPEPCRSVLLHFFIRKNETERATNNSIISNSL